MSAVIALGIPHTPWRPERVASLAHLREVLDREQVLDQSDVRFRLFTDREPNHAWSERMWRWAAERDADFFVTLQDDSLVPSFFWPALRAMLEHLPRGAVLGLAAQHPDGPELARRGERWYRTRSWAVGTGYGLWREDLEAFLGWRSLQAPARLAGTTEDTLLNQWVGDTGRTTWHPLPTIVQHDLSLETNYQGNDEHEYRESSFTWQHAIDPDGGGEEGLAAMLSDPGFWKQSALRRRAAAAPPLLPFPKPKPIVRPELPELADVETAAGTIALAISHTPWVPARVVSCERLLEQLSLIPQLRDGKEHAVVPRHAKDGLRHMKVVTDRAANDVWSERMWRWAAETSAEWCLFLQDDVEVCPTFWGALRGLLESCPGQVIGFEVAHPVARALAGEGETRLFTTRDMLIGPGYLLPRALLREFLAWRKTKLRAGWIGQLHEDTMIGLWCATTGRRIVHPIPTIIDHDTSIASTYGNDEHVNRRPHVTWKDAAQYDHAWNDEDLEGAGFWQGRFKRVRRTMSDGSFMGYARATNMDPAVIAAGARVPHLGCFYGAESGASTAVTAQRWVEGLTEREILRIRQDTGDREKRRLAYSIRSRGDWSGRARILVCTPTRGGTHPIYSASMTSLVSLFEADLEHGLELLGTWQWDEDVVRVRSRFLRATLETDATHVHFRDADVGASPECLLGMLRVRREFVATPYPRRDSLDLRAIVERVRQGDHRPVEAFAYHYAVQPLPETETLLVDDQGCAEVASMPLGCSLLERGCIERMIAHYDALDRKRVDLEAMKRELTRTPSRSVLERYIRELGEELQRWRAGHMGLRFTDLHERQLRETVAVFQLLVRGPEGARPLMSEDASFCARLRDMGGKVWMYLGPGSPGDHAGEHVYRGRIEAFGLQRVPRRPTHQPHPDDVEAVREGLEEAERGELLSAEESAAYVQKLVDEGAPVSPGGWVEGAGIGLTGATLVPTGPGLVEEAPPSSREREAFALDSPEDPLREPEEPLVP